MFGKIKIIGGKSPDSFDKTSELNAFLGEGTKFEGSLSFEGTVRVEGTLKGDIFAKDILIVGNNGKVDGEIEVDTIIINGYVKGNIRAARRVEISPPGKFYGNIETPTFVLHEGAVFEGNCSMEQIKHNLTKTKFSSASKETDHHMVKEKDKDTTGISTH